jgi:hypothetical protein
VHRFRETADELAKLPLADGFVAGKSGEIGALDVYERLIGLGAGLFDDGALARELSCPPDSRYRRTSAASTVSGSRYWIDHVDDCPESRMLSLGGVKLGRAR